MLRLITILLASSFLSGVARADDPRILYLVPFGRAPDLSDADVAVVEHALESFYTVTVKVLDHRDLPKAAYYKPRHRYRAEKLLDELNRIAPKDAWRIMGITAVDISTTKPPYDDWGIMGLGELPGTASVLSVFRCKKGAQSQAHAYERLGKVAVHELGHTLGLAHCPTPKCLMEDANGKVSTVDEETDFCEECKRALGAALKVRN